MSNSTTAEDYSSAVDIDSSDMEFYDLSDDESIKTITPLDKVSRYLYLHNWLKSDNAF